MGVSRRGDCIRTLHTTPASRDLLWITQFQITRRLVLLTKYVDRVGVLLTSLTCEGALMNRAANSTVSVDVLTLRYNPAEREVEVAVVPRISDPYAGQLALPGIVLREGERLADAAQRAAAAKLQTQLIGQGQLTVFDEPLRDPRGATLSIAMWGVAANEGGPTVRWFALDDVPKLAFDHNEMLTACRPLLVGHLWRNLDFTRAVTGPSFPVSSAVAITKSLTGMAPDRGNLNRRLASVRGLEVSHRKVVLGRGRPGTLWEWSGEE